MQIRARIDVLNLVQNTLRSQKNLVYSTAQGLNDTARKIQEAQRKRLPSEFKMRTGRSKAFLEREIAVIKPFASVKTGTMYTEVRVGQKRRLLLSKFEPGADRGAFVGKNIAVPVVGGPARPTFPSTVNAQYTFNAMRLKQTTATKKRSRAAKKAGGPAQRKQFKGENGTFIIHDVGVFVRTGKAKRDIDLLYDFRSRQKLNPKLRWLKTARQVSNRWLSESITQRFLRSNRPARTP